MALKFKCQNCGKDIIIVYRKAGQVVKCIACGIENVIPKNAIETTKKPEQLDVAVTEKTTKETITQNTLGPRKLEDMLSEAFRIYKQHYLKLWGIAAISSVLNVLFIVAMYGAGFLIALLSEGDKIIAVLPYIIAGGAFAITVFIAVNLWVQCALMYFIAVQYHATDIGFSDSYAYAWSKLGTAFVTSILVSLAVGGLTLTIIGIPLAIYIGVNWCFALPYVVIKGTGITEALSKSYALVKGNWWRVLGINLMFAVIMFGINSVAGVIPILGWMISAIVGTPVVILGLVLLYFDLRVRKQEYTLDDLTKELNIGSRP